MEILKKDLGQGSGILSLFEDVVVNYRKGLFVSFT